MLIGVEESLVLCNKYDFSFDDIKSVSVLMPRHQTAELFDKLSKGPLTATHDVVTISCD
jgi:hypothetical protein